MARRRRVPSSPCACPPEARDVLTRVGRRVCIAPTARGPRFVRQVCDTEVESARVTVEVVAARESPVPEPAPAASVVVERVEIDVGE